MDSPKNNSRLRLIALIVFIMSAVLLIRWGLSLRSSELRIAYIYRADDNSGLHVIRPDGTERKTLVQSNAAPRWLERYTWRLPFAQEVGIHRIYYTDAFHFPEWLPGTEMISYRTREIGQYCEWVNRIRPNGGKPEKLTCLSADVRVEYSDWAPDGSRFAFITTEIAGRTIRLLDLSGETIEHRALDAEVRGLAWSPDSRMIALTTGGSAPLHLLDREGAIRELKPDSDAIGRPAWSADSRTLAYFCTGESQIDICLIQADGSQFRRIRFEREFPYIKSGLTWSPGSDAIAFSAIQHGGNSDIFLISANGADIRQLTQDLSADTAPRWSPDGEALAFSSRRNGNWDIYTIRRDGSALTQVTSLSGNELEPVWIPASH